MEELCALAVRCGDLDALPFEIPERRADDKELYYRIQSEAGAYYNPNFELSNTVERNGIYFTVSSLADGIIRKESGAVVDKIKTVKGREAYFPPDLMTLAMLKCSAYFFCVKEDLPFVKARVSCYDEKNKKFRYFNYRFARVELMSFYFSLLDKILWRARIAEERETEALSSAKNAVFPYADLREGQEWMIKDCYSAIKQGKRIFVEAPTGIGKTISALFPAVRALGKGYCDKIFYLTPKTAAGREAFSASAKLFGAGVKLRTVTISAKEQICPCRNGVKNAVNPCSSDVCEYSRGYYDRVDDALKYMTDGYNGYSRSLILETARKFRVCPYELSLDLSELCDVIICDYNYVFDPLVYLRRYFGSRRRKGGDGNDEKYVFLIDEAHNLADRARDAYSAELRSSAFENAVSELDACGTWGDEPKKMTEPVISALRSLKRLCKDTLTKDENGNDRGFYVSSSPYEKLDGTLEIFAKKCGQWLRKNENSPAYGVMQPLYSAVSGYLKIREFFDVNFRFYVEISDGDTLVKTYCLNPSDVLGSLLCRASAAVMFSATLTPTEYFCDVLGGGKNARRLSLPSPFSTENLCVAVADYVNTRYDGRKDNAKTFAEVIAATVSARKGNYIAYFPSYQCLEQTYRAFVKKYPQVETVVQKKYMNPSEREEFLSGFKADADKIRVGFCVLGGVFSEGVDLPGSRLIGSVIFGVGLPGLSNERNMIREYFDGKSGDETGYDYAYTYPGMNNVLQAAGRVIRTEDDVGVVVLADDRYASAKYRALFPKHWQGVQYAGNASSLAEIMRRFWKNQG